MDRVMQKSYCGTWDSLDFCFQIDRSNFHGIEHRHRQTLPVEFSSTQPGPPPHPARALGTVYYLSRGWANHRVLFDSWRRLRRQEQVFFYWPQEKAVEKIDSHGWRSQAKAFFLVSLYRVFRKEIPAFHDPRETQDELSSRDFSGMPRADFERAVLHRLNFLRNQAQPVAWRPTEVSERASWGKGIYLRLDYWAKAKVGGSVGHTAYVARELQKRSDSLEVILAQPSPLLGDFGIPQRVVGLPGSLGVERHMLEASESYVRLLAAGIRDSRPDYLYERIVPGNYTGAFLSRELKIPYWVEYNGSEISMMKSFAGRSYDFEYLFYDAEKAAFTQASVISVISDAVRDQVIALGADPAKILVNPNGVDPEDFRPALPGEREAIHRELGWPPGTTGIGFVGTFGGWHGIEVLAAALAPICQACPEARFLLIGEGNLHHLVEASVQKHRLEKKVVLTGTLPARETRRLLRGCAIFVSPHHAHMVDSRFFGSPTKIFEYMALGGAIVASDLEQIGEVLRPCLFPQNLPGDPGRATDARAVLCPPGDREAFVRAVVAVGQDPGLAMQLGRNARAAVLREFTWAHHVDRLGKFAMARGGAVSTPRPVVTPAGNTGTSAADPDKREIQKQWDHDACGSHYVQNAENRLDFFRKAETFRHGEYAPWMPRDMEFSRHRGKKILEIGAGMGTDLAQFALAGNDVTDLDLSAGHLAHARENFALRGLAARFEQGDAENLPFPDASFDLVYSNGVIHHTPRTQVAIDEIFRVLRPGGQAIVMVYRENSIQFWRDILFWRGIRQGQLRRWSLGEIMSRSVEISDTGARPLVKVYSSAKVRKMFSRFGRVRILRRQLMPHERPVLLRWLPASLLQRFLGWNLIIKARKPA